GLEVAFPDAGPKVASPVRTSAAIDALRVPDPEAELPFVMAAVRQIKAALAGRVPLIGFAGAPLTRMTYAVEGGGSKDYAHTKAMLYGAPAAAHALLDKLARTCASYLEAQVAAGADAVQIFDSWGGIVSPGDFREYPLRHARRVIELLRGSPTWKTRAVPIIYFVNGCAPYLDDYASSGADVLGVDWRGGIDEGRPRGGGGVPPRGNPHPGALFAPAAALHAAGAR